MTLAATSLPATTLLIVYLYLLLVHWFADFVLQTSWQATNKSKRLDALSAHVLVYTATLALYSSFLFSTCANWFVFWFLNGILHFCTDYVTSRISSKLYAEQDYHNFFVVIGFDQFIHQLTLAGLLVVFLR